MGTLNFQWNDEEDLEKQFQWTDNMVMDFVNYYIRLKKIDFRYTLENKTILDEFKREIMENKQITLI